MAQVRGAAAACSAAPPGRFFSGSSLGCQQQRQQLWRPAKEVLQFLTECALPPPPLAITMELGSDTSHAKPDADADAPVNTKRPPPARWEPPAQMKIMRAAASSSCSSEGVTFDQQVREASGICNEGLMEKEAGQGTVQTESINSQDFSPKPSVGSNSFGSKNGNFMQAAASPDCSPRAPGQATIDIWQFPRPSKTPSSKTVSSGQSTQHLPPKHKTGEQSKIPCEDTTKVTFPGGEIERNLSWDRSPVTSRTIPKNTNAFARAACSQSSGWAPQPRLQRTVGLSPLNMKASGFETCVAQNNSFGAFASGGQDEIANKEAPQVFPTTQKCMENPKSDNAGKSTPSIINVNVSNSFVAPQENIANPQIEGSTAIQVEVANAVSENDQPAALDLLVNAVQVASGTPSVAGDKGLDYDKEVGADNTVSDNSLKVQKMSYFVHGRIPFKQKRITRRAKSAYQKSQNAHKDTSDIIAVDPVLIAIPPWQQSCAQANLEGKAQEQACSFQEPKSPNFMHGRENNEKQIHQQHKSLEAILFGYDSPIVQLRRERTKILPSRNHDALTNTAYKRSRSRNFRRNSDIWRLNE